MKTCKDYGIVPICKHCNNMHWTRCSNGQFGWKEMECFIYYWKDHFPRIPMNIIKKKYLTNIYLQKALELYYPKEFEELSKLLILL
jgi:hypothetical protein